MALSFGIMIEGQEGLTWPRWQRLARTVEDAGYDALFRSDHLTGVLGDSKLPSLETWACLTWLATGTSRIRFGPCVSPLTFYQPAVLAKRAAAIADLSGGRFDLGIGAGWHEGEHTMFGIPFPPVKERLDRLECGARAIRALWEGRPVTLDQPYYPLRAAESYPLPPGGRVPLIIGGGGEKRTLRIVAEHADEWNITRVTFDSFAAKRNLLEDYGRQVGRDARTIRRSLMVPIIVGQSAADVLIRRRKACSIFPRLPGDEASWRAAGFLYGSIDRVVRDLKRWEELGIQRLMLQLIDQDDLEVIELIARHVLPEFRQ
jgi:alkanesulfonate monooxygenase SsuD/methylene tetrahydromethanopterin reductase-like flavin-dependent oxidoreductase (luciferase family)